MCDRISLYINEKFDQEIASLSYSQEKDADVICALTRIRNSIKRTAECAAEIAEITIDQTYKIPANEEGSKNL